MNAKEICSHLKFQFPNSVRRESLYIKNMDLKRLSEYLLLYNVSEVSKVNINRL